MKKITIYIYTSDKDESIDNCINNIEAAVDMLEDADLFIEDTIIED